MMFYKVRKKLSTVFVLFVIHHDNDLFWSEELILFFLFFSGPLEIKFKKEFI